MKKTYFPTSIEMFGEHNMSDICPVTYVQHIFFWVFRSAKIKGSGTSDITNLYCKEYTSGSFLSADFGVKTDAKLTPIF